DVLAHGQLAVHVDAGHGLVGRVLRPEHLGAGLEGGGVGGGPPVALAALVVEAVGQLVTDHAADRAVVDRRVGVRVEDRRLQDAGREHDVDQRAVVGVVGLRGHAPVLAVYGPLGAFGVERPVRLGGAVDVADQVVVADQDRGVVAGRVGIADLDVVGGELL